MRKVELTVDITLNVEDDIQDNQIYEAICTMLCGPWGHGLVLYKNQTEYDVVADNHEISIKKKAKEEWGSSMS